MAPMITWKDFQKLMPWEIVILVGGGYALAAGCKVLYMCWWTASYLMRVRKLLDEKSRSDLICLCVCRCQACQCGSADSWSPWVVFLRGPSPCWPACWCQRSQSLPPTLRLLPSSCPSCQRWYETPFHTTTVFSILGPNTWVWVALQGPVNWMFRDTREEQKYWQKFKKNLNFW